MRSSPRLTAEVSAPTSLGKGEFALWRDWRAADPSLRSPFLAPDYIRAVGQVHAGARIAVILRNGRIQAFLPFQYPTALSQGLRHGEPIGGAMTDAVGAIAAPEFRVDSQGLLGAIGLDSFLFTHLIEDQQRCGLSPSRFDQGLAIDLSAGAEAYWQRLHAQRPGVIREIERRRRRIERELGPLAFRFRSEAPFSVLEKLIVLKREQYRRTGVADALRVAWKRDLLRRLAALQSADCAGVLSVLEAGGQLLAAHFGLRSGAVLHYWFPVYAPELAPFAPGRLLLAGMIDAAADEGIRRIERGTGTGPAKRDFANAEVTYGRGMVRTSSWRSLLVRLGLSAQWRWQGATGWARGRLHPPAPPASQKSAESIPLES
ncbi:MAG TPA: GNAT family N-acetyltransferase [Alphaproteobacteria bacterium]|nr:GNAT family N-acetyltransferase [Alphaproteobacteria bacterium]